MSGLREALEKLADERDSVSGHVANDYHIRPYELRELLAAHPAEPTPEQVEAASAPGVPVEKVRAVARALRNAATSGAFCDEVARTNEAAALAVETLLPKEPTS
jgi:hypothetical protein